MPSKHWTRRWAVRVRLENREGWDEETVLRRAYQQLLGEVIRRLDRCDEEGEYTYSVPIAMFADIDIEGVEVQLRLVCYPRTLGEGSEEAEEEEKS